MFDFEYHLKHLPDKPGVYIMKNSSGEVIYVGKAKILKNRVRQYFQNSKNKGEKVRAMVSNISEFEYIITDSEMEALILECNLIKKYRPRYNILLKDDKSYPMIKITVNEDFPRVLMVRHTARDGSKYLGPYPDAGAVYEILELIKKVFPVRNCKMMICEGKTEKRPCLNYQIGLCCAPCSGFISKYEYAKIINDIIDLLTGKNKDIVKKLKSEMESASENLEFEKAASLRDKIIAIEKINEKQKITSPNAENEDFINIISDETDTCAQVFFLRDGKVIGREHFILNNTGGGDSREIISDFIEEFYGGTAFIPKNIYAPPMQDMELIEEWLSLKKGSKVQIKNPVRGEKKDFMDMVSRNAKITLEQFKLKIMQDKALEESALKDLTDILAFDEVPYRIEAYDISNIQGVDSVGSMIVFENGKPKNSDYRRFRIKTVKGANDYDSMKEIIRRRFEHGLQEVRTIKDRQLNFSAGKFCIFPELILMDGGKGQVNAALDILNDLNINIPVCGMVKDDRHNTRGLIYNNREIEIMKDSNAMNLIRRIQDEAHRFAITYHRSLRDKRGLHSVLQDIPNIGEKRKLELLSAFGSVEKIKSATFDELIQVPSIDSKAAKSILQFFSK